MNIQAIIYALIERGFDSIGYSHRISWPDAGGDKCLICGVIRREHDSKKAGHMFNESNGG